MRAMDLSPATARDYDRLTEIWEAAVRATHHFLAEADIELFRPLVRQGYLPAAERLWLARDASGRAQGFVGVDQDKVEMLFVDPASHGQGVGKQLLRHAIEQWDARRVDVNEQNPGAVAFYLHMGFVQEGRSERDGMGHPFPLLHLRLGQNPPNAPHAGPP